MTDKLGSSPARRSKHMRRWLRRIGSGNAPLLTPVPTLGGRVVRGGQQYPIETKATARLPWQQRAKNRRRSKAARKSRVANARRARRG